MRKNSKKKKEFIFAEKAATDMSPPKIKESNDSMHLDESINWIMANQDATLADLPAYFHDLWFHDPSDDSENPLAAQVFLMAYLIKKSKDKASKKNNPKKNKKKRKRKNKSRKKFPRKAPQISASASEQELAEKYSYWQVKLGIVGARLNNLIEVPNAHQIKLFSFEDNEKFHFKLTPLGEIERNRLFGPMLD